MVFVCGVECGEGRWRIQEKKRGNGKGTNKKMWWKKSAGDVQKKKEGQQIGGERNIM